MQLELLAVAEEHERVALIDEPGVAALTPLLGAAHVGFNRVAAQVGRPDHHLGATADGVVAWPHEHLARRLRPCAGRLCRAHRSTTSAASSAACRDSRNQTSTAAAVSPARAPGPSRRRRSLSRNRAEASRRDVDAIGADRAGELIDRPCGRVGLLFANEIALGIEQPQAEVLFLAGCEQRSYGKTCTCAGVPGVPVGARGLGLRS